MLFGPMYLDLFGPEQSRHLNGSELDAAGERFMLEPVEVCGHAVSTFTTYLVLQWEQAYPLPSTPLLPKPRGRAP